MKNKVNKVINIFILFLLIVGTYYYDDIEKFLLNGKIERNIGNIVNKNTNNLEISYLDVGQADSILIRKNNNNILIDAGNNEDGEKLVHYFKDQKIEKFDYVIGTHAHEDHIGGMDDIIANFKINHFYMPNVITTTKTFEDILDNLDRYNIKFETPKIDSTFEVDDLKFTVLSITDNKEELNDTSIVLKLTYKNTNYLFMGDASSKIENSILHKDIKSNVIKVSHHGSSYSSSAKFIKKVDPDYAIISVGKNNSYNHPKSIVLKKFERLGTIIYRTDKQSTIKLTSDGENIKIETIKTDTNGG